MKLFATLFALFAAAGCTGRGLESQNGDLGGAHHDFADEHHDFALASDFSFPSTTIDLATNPSGTQTCLDIAGCASGCSTFACANACAQMGTPLAQSEYQALLTCGYAACTMAGAGNGPAQCMSTSDTSSGCLSCIAQVAQSMACAAQLTACFEGM